MRLIGTIFDPTQAKEFSAFLTKEGIENQCEPLSTSGASHIWVIDEDQLDQALEWFEKFKRNPHDPLFYGHIKHFSLPSRQPSINLTKLPTPQPPIKSLPQGKITIAILVLCAFVFIWQMMSTPSSAPRENVNLVSEIATISKAQRDLMFDYPKFYEIAAQIYRLYTPEQIQNTANAPAELTILLRKLEQTPYWQGYYTLFMNEWKHSSFSWIVSAPLFEKIRAGEVWRLVTPAILHADILHIFFNMIWLVVLGSQIENRIGVFRYILLILISAVFSNTAQYLMSGPNFIGFSGVVCAMAAFIWARQRKAPWEGYLLQRSTIVFIALFIFAMFALQLFSFFSEILGGPLFAIAIANTAHLSGAAVGFLLGQLKVFSRLKS